MSTDKPQSSRSDLIIAAAIAIISIATALLAWRASVLGSAAGEESRTGLMDAIKLQAYTSEARRLLFQEAEFAFEYAAYVAELDAMAASADAGQRAQSVTLRQYVLPQMAQLTPLSNAKYAKSDGTLDYEKRLAELRAEQPQIAKLKPLESFARANYLFIQQRITIWAAALLAFGLFWLALAEISGGRRRALGVILAVVSTGAGVSIATLASLIARVIGGGL